MGASGARSGLFRRGRVARSRALLGLVAACLLAGAAGGWGTLRIRERSLPAHVTLLDGNDWVELSLNEKERLVEGFVLGAATEQVQRSRSGVAVVDGRSLGRAVVELRSTAGLDVPFAPALLARRVDEFYWWRNNRDVTRAGALAEINDQLRHQHR
jgi:hypothetical protein